MKPFNDTTKHLSYTSTLKCQFHGNDLDRKISCQQYRKLFKYIQIVRRFHWISFADIEDCQFLHIIH